ncbi:hypothetical protein [Carboxylicivirga litoralis]|nr:hypothetical protein [Carboxylicivirga sp. A043]
MALNVIVINNIIDKGFVNRRYEGVVKVIVQVVYSENKSKAEN